MDYRYKQLEQDMSALSNAFSELGARLSEAAKDVTTGVMPSEKLVEQILTARTTFEKVRGAVHEQASSMLVSPLPKPGELASIPTIDALLKAAAKAEESKSSAEGERERASAILTRVLAITHREMGDFKPLQECQAKVTALRNAISTAAWPNRHPEAESVLALKHPSTILLNFVENLDTLEDEKWMALEATITEAYGKPLFVAASRGKLLAQQTPTKAPAPAKPVPVAEKVVEKKVVPEKPTGPVAEPSTVERKIVAPPETAAPVHVTPAPPTAPLPMAPAAIAQTPPMAAPAPSAAVPQRPPAPVPPPAQPTLAPSPAHTNQQAAPAPIASLSALANATEPVVDRKPTGAPADAVEKPRREPRLAVPGPQPVARTEPPSHEQEQVGDESSKALAGDGTQRPQRWGFWRGNR